MIRKKIQRVRSRAAFVSKLLGAMAVFVFVVLVVMHKSGELETTRFLLLLGITLLVAAAGVVSGLVGLRRLWQDGDEGGRRSVTGIALSLVVLSPVALLSYKFLTHPRLSDISTDLQDPPMFEGEQAHRVEAELQAKSYPAVTGRRYEIPAEPVIARLEELIAAEGWQNVQRRDHLDSDREFLLQMDARTFLFGFRDFVMIRVTDEDRTAFVDMRSKSEFGDSDLGANAARIISFLNALDERLAREAGGQARQ